MSEHSLRGLEGKICDIADLAEVAAFHIGEVILNPHERERKSGRALPLSEQEIRHILFFVYQLDQGVTDLKKDFYQRFNA